MTLKRAVPMLAERLTLYASDAELRTAIFGAKANSDTIDAIWAGFIRDPAFPKAKPTMGGRHVPSVMEWFEAREKRESVPPVNEWAREWNMTKSERRASHGALVKTDPSRTG